MFLYCSHTTAVVAPLDRPKILFQSRTNIKPVLGPRPVDALADIVQTQVFGSLPCTAFKWREPFHVLLSDSVLRCTLKISIPGPPIRSLVGYRSHPPLQMSQFFYHPFELVRALVFSKNQIHNLVPWSISVVVTWSHSLASRSAVLRTFYIADFLVDRRFPHLGKSRLASIAAASTLSAETNLHKIRLIIGTIANTIAHVVRFPSEVIRRIQQASGLESIDSAFESQPWLGIDRSSKGFMRTSAPFYHTCTTFSLSVSKPLISEFLETRSFH